MHIMIGCRADLAISSAHTAPHGHANRYVVRVYYEIFFRDIHTDRSLTASKSYTRDYI